MRPFTNPPIAPPNIGIKVKGSEKASFIPPPAALAKPTNLSPRESFLFSTSQMIYQTIYFYFMKIFSYFLLYFIFLINFQEIQVLQFDYHFISDFLLNFL